MAEDGNVIIIRPIAEEGIQLLQEAGLRPFMASSTEEETLIEEVRDVSAILVRNTKINANIMDAASKLKVIGKHGVGVDNIDIEAATERGITVTNAPDSNKESVAEHTLMLMLSCAKDLIQADHAQREGKHDFRDDYHGTELWGKKLGVVGFGTIGRTVACKAESGFNMEILAYDPYITSEEMPEGVTLANEMTELLATSDFVSLHCPLTDETEGLVGKSELTAMQPSSYLINAARGGVVIERDLLWALENDEIAGTATDVYEQEPPPADHPLFGREDVVVTPHIAALTKESRVKMSTGAARGIIDVLQGRSPKNQIN